MTTMLAAIFVFGLLVFVHELGHFAIAKMVGMRVEEFALGFGPKIFGRREGETLYSLRAIPLGGFNKISGMDPDEEQDERSFNAQPVWARMLVIVAGSVMNFILPVLLFVIIFLASGIDKPSNLPLVGQTMPNKPAAAAGIQAGDQIIRAAGQEITQWKQFVAIIQANGGTVIELEVERNGQRLLLAVTPEQDQRLGRGIIGVVPQIDKFVPGVGESIGLAFKQTALIAVGMGSGLVEMIAGRAAADVAGPIGVAQMAGEVAKTGVIPLLQFAAFLSINLGIINLLPVPVLDGGHLVTLAVEGIRGRPLTKGQLQFTQMVGFAILLAMLLLTTYKDVARLNLF